MDNEKPATRSELDSAIGSLKSELVDAMRSQKNELLDSMRQIETNLLTEFHRYAKGQNARIHNVEVSENDMKLRLSVLEDRVLALETRIPPSTLWRYPYTGSVPASQTPSLVSPPMRTSSMRLAARGEASATFK